MTRQSLQTRLLAAKAETVCLIASRKQRGIAPTPEQQKRLLLQGILHRAVGVFNADELDLISCWLTAGSPA